MTKHDLNREKVLETVGVLALVALLAGTVTGSRPLLLAAVALLAVGLFVKPVARWIAAGWLAFGDLLGAVNSRILLSLIYYLLLTPIALLARLFRGDFLHLGRRTEGGRSYWLRRDHRYTAADLEKPW